MLMACVITAATTDVTETAGVTETVGVMVTAGAGETILSKEFKSLFL